MNDLYAKLLALMILITMLTKIIEGLYIWSIIIYLVVGGAIYFSAIVDGRLHSIKIIGVWMPAIFSKKIREWVKK